MLDLTTSFGEPYQLKLADGTVLTLKRPTQALQQSILNMQKFGSMDGTNEKDVNRAMSTAMDIFVRILNRNTDGLEFDVKQVSEEYDYTVALMVITDYLKYYSQEVSRIIPFQSAQMG